MHDKRITAHVKRKNLEKVECRKKSRKLKFIKKAVRFTLHAVTGLNCLLVT